MPSRPLQHTSQRRLEPQHNQRYLAVPGTLRHPPPLGPPQRWAAGARMAVGSSPGGDTEEAARSKLESLYEGFKRSFAEVPDVEVQELHGWLQDAASRDTLLLVDVRTQPEQQVSMLPGPHTLTQQQFEERGPEAFRGRRIICYCTAGYRSGMYARRLRSEYGLDAANLRGSILAWTQAGLPLADPQQPPAGAGAAVTTTRVHVFSRDWALQGPGYTPVMFRRPLLQLLLHSLGGWWRAAVRGWRGPVRSGAAVDGATPGTGSGRRGPEGG
ncbi:hypothetical protein TSOC_010597 [Tetrabaena socialis]|uniref:Rhodanese domain-containing protein n=1 Tax=Tetrabaena socialis TaxID=47790 RepID=A0A2J7ZSX6_9CHLO|nr:hypothetical protein TSOC_010597 [Tetrabaena socialis]|eukprot:PNH03371.1 hypothetical protein TSOC_010597 [Tetrabaena socialis]